MEVSKRRKSRVKILHVDPTVRALSESLTSIAMALNVTPTPSFVQEKSHE